MFLVKYIDPYGLIIHRTYTNTDSNRVEAIIKSEWRRSHWQHLATLKVG